MRFRDHVRVSLTGRLDRLGVAWKDGHAERFEARTWLGEGLMMGCQVVKVLTIALKAAVGSECSGWVLPFFPSLFNSFELESKRVN